MLIILKYETKIIFKLIPSMRYYKQSWKRTILNKWIKQFWKKAGLYIYWSNMKEIYNECTGTKHITFDQHIWITGFENKLEFYRN